jgi:two-component system response regulator CpxR
MDVLLIEPDKHLTTSYQQALENRGLEVMVAHSGQAAIAVIDTTKPRLICLEVHLPKHNGIEFLHELRSYPEWEDIPVVLLTFVSEKDLNLQPSSQSQLGISHYFYKPRTELKQLVSYISGVLQ